MRLFTIALILGLAIPAAAQTYTSPFEINLSPNVTHWTSDFAKRSPDITADSSPAPSQWYTTNYTNFDPYGPLLPQLYSSASSAYPNITNELKFDRGKGVYKVALNNPPQNVKLLSWQQARLLEAARQLIGTHYQHLHLPQFNPASVTNPAFPWKAVSNNATLTTTQNLDTGTKGTARNPYRAAYGFAQPGIDCTDFAAYIYNLALGIQMHSGTSTQVTFTRGSGPANGNQPTATVLSTTGAIVTPKFLLGPNYGTQKRNAPGSLDSVISQLQPGDLLYIQAGTHIVHVVVWLGKYGTNANGTPSYIPLVISSHDNTPAIFDTTQINPTTGLPLDGNTNGHLPPNGVEILPFDSSNWFYQNFSLAMQVLPNITTPAP